MVERMIARYPDNPVAHARQADLLTMQVLGLSLELAFELSEGRVLLLPTTRR